MASNLLNDRTIRSTLPQDVEIFLNDGDGLRLRIRPNGGRDWFYIYRRPGVLTPTKLMLGSYPTLKLADAREIATEYRKLRQQGLDPKVVREEAERKQAQAWASNPLPQTLSELVDYWSDHYLTRTNRDGRMRRKDGGAEIIRAFKADVLPVLGNMRLPDIRKGHIAAILDEILSRGSNRMANQMLSNLRQLFRFAVSRDFMDIEPTAGLEKKD
ncbi:MAG: tyrosine-type recombinase/integrase, partial [Gammaproteobacteria bacterium]